MQRNGVRSTALGNILDNSNSNQFHSYPKRSRDLVWTVIYKYSYGALQLRIFSNERVWCMLITFHLFDYFFIS